MKRLLPAFLLFFAVAFITTFIHMGVIRTGRVVSRLQQEVSIKEARNQYEQLEIARLSGPEEVTTFAAATLGMVQEKPHEVFVLDKP